MMTSTWQPIPSTAGFEEAAVLLRYACTLDSLSIHLTDLSQVWTEDLNRDQICERARSVECSIDPSEDESQLSILLEKIEAALRGDDATSLSVVVDGPDHLMMKISSPLPHPLPPLKWSARLGPGSREQVKTEVMVPLVCSTYMRKQQEDDLVALLAAKDKLMSKMMDKIESLGVDLVSLFPQYGSRAIKGKRDQRGLLAKEYPQIGPFKEEAWRSRFDSTLHDGVGFRDMSGIAFRESSTKAVKGLFDKLDTSVFRPLPELLRDGKPRKKMAREETLDEFQHQITPQKVRKKVARAQRTINSDNETTDDEGTTSPTPKNRSPRSTSKKNSSNRTTPASTKRLGTISASKRKAALAHEARRSKEPEDIQQDTAVSPSLNRKAAQEAPPTVAPRQESPQSRRTSTTSASSASANESKKRSMDSPAVIAKRSRLGRIGGGTAPRRSETPDPQQSEQDHVAAVSVSENTLPTSQPRTPRKLGRIGGRRPDATQGSSQILPPSDTQTERNEASQLVGQGNHTRDTQEQKGDRGRLESERPRTPTPEMTLPGESQEEKVIRKRKELEREMSQVRTTPKKKRKF